jgi:hypothetical protein
LRKKYKKKNSKIKSKQNQNINTNSNSNQITQIQIQTQTKCKCSKTQCLKKYCECFASGRFCIDCDCIDCENIPTNAEKLKALRETLLLEENKNENKIVCNCTHSECQKKYCKCYKAGRRCNSECRCINCENCDKNNNKKLKKFKTKRKISSRYNSITKEKLINFNDSFNENKNKNKNENEDENNYIENISDNSVNNEDNSENIKTSSYIKSFSNLRIFDQKNFGIYNISLLINGQNINVIEKIFNEKENDFEIINSDFNKITNLNKNDFENININLDLNLRENKTYNNKNENEKIKQYNNNEKILEKKEKGEFEEIKLKNNFDEIEDKYKETQKKYENNSIENKIITRRSNRIKTNSIPIRNYNQPSIDNSLFYELNNISFDKEKEKLEKIEKNIENTSKIFSLLLKNIF